MDDRLRRALARVRTARRRMAGRPRIGRLVSILACAAAGFMIATSAITSGGVDLRPDRNTDLAGLVQQESARNKDLAAKVASLRADVDALANAQDKDPLSSDRVEAAAQAAGHSPVAGPAVSVTLTDAPPDVAPARVDEDLLVVHQQDIQAVINALWAGGAEAMTVQGQRVVSTTGVKCVGNTVLLHGVPYAPPYVIVAIGKQDALEAALASASAVQIYRQYVQAYGLGYRQERLAEVTMPAYRGSVDISAQRAG